MAKASPKRRGRRAGLGPSMLRRVVVEAVTPQVDEGRYPAKTTTGEDVVVEADVFADGHDVLAAVVLWRRRGAATWRETKKAPLGDDPWPGPVPGRGELANLPVTLEGLGDRP